MLDAIDGAIERAEAVVAATKRLRDALLYELLTRGVPGWHSAWREVPGVGVSAGVVGGGTAGECGTEVALGVALRPRGGKISLDGEVRG